MSHADLLLKGDGIELHASEDVLESTGRFSWGLFVHVTGEGVHHVKEFPSLALAIRHAERLLQAYPNLNLYGMSYWDNEGAEM